MVEIISNSDLTVVNHNKTMLFFHFILFVVLGVGTMIPASNELIASWRDDTPFEIISILGVFSGAVFILCSLVSVLVMFKGKPKIILTSEGIEYQDFFSIYSAKWDSVIIFKKEKNFSKPEYLTTYIVGPNVSKNLTGILIWKIQFSYFKADIKTVLDDINRRVSKSWESIPPGEQGAKINAFFKKKGQTHLKPR